MCTSMVHYVFMKYNNTTCGWHCACSLVFSSLSTLAWLRQYHKCGIIWGDHMGLPPSQHQHCTDESQKAETVLSAVSYIIISLYLLLLNLTTKLMNIYMGCSFAIMDHPCEYEKRGVKVWTKEKFVYKPSVAISWERDLSRDLARGGGG